MKIFLGIIAAFLLFGMIGSRHDEERRCLTWAFIADVVGIIALYKIG